MTMIEGQRATTPASDAEQEEREAHRVPPSPGTQAWETFPADSEAERDYTPGELGEQLEFQPLQSINDSPPELLVETTVYFPDGRRVVTTEAIECAEATDHDALELVRRVNRASEFRFQTQAF